MGPVGVKDAQPNAPCVCNTCNRTSRITLGSMRVNCNSSPGAPPCYRHTAAAALIPTLSTLCSHLVLMPHNDRRTPHPGCHGPRPIGLGQAHNGLDVATQGQKAAQALLPDRSHHQCRQGWRELVMGGCRLRKGYRVCCRGWVAWTGQQGLQLRRQGL